MEKKKITTQIPGSIEMLSAIRTVITPLISDTSEIIKYLTIALSADLSDGLECIIKINKIFSDISLTTKKNQLRIQLTELYTHLDSDFLGHARHATFCINTLLINCNKADGALEAENYDINIGTAAYQKIRDLLKTNMIDEENVSELGEFFQQLAGELLIVENLIYQFLQSDEEIEQKIQYLRLIEVRLEEIISLTENSFTIRDQIQDVLYA